MFEVIISEVRTGKVRRELFDTRAEAEGFADREEIRLTSPTRPGGKARSMRRFRLEIAYRDMPAILGMPVMTPRPAAVAA